MRLVTVPAAAAVGKILCHNILDSSGRKAFRKGQIVKPEDVARLLALGHDEICVAKLEPGDVHEDAAATRLAQAVSGPGLQATKPSTGRVNLTAAERGVLYVQPEALAATNAPDGLTVATLRRHTVVPARKIVATLKIIPYAVPEQRLRSVEAVLQETGPVVWLRPLLPRQVSLILTGSEAGRAGVIAGFEPPLRERVEALGSRSAPAIFVPEDAQHIARAVQGALDGGSQLIILAGETSIMDVDDVTPQGIRLAGARIEHYGVPVEPGNLLLLAYAGDVPIMGAPGCARSRHINVIDLVLPRLLAGERVQGGDLAALGEGGLL